MAGKKKSKAKSTKSKGKGELAAALKEAEGSPGKEELWEKLETLAGELQRPDEVAKLYRKVLGKSKGIARRALSFHEEWFGDDPDAMSGVLNRILEVEPGARWAFERLCMELTQASRWDELLGVYDRALGRETEPDRRRKLLDDAAHVAKDFADAPERALDYMGKMLELEPGNSHLVASLERLYERLGRWQEVIELWRGRIPTAGKEAGEIRARIASTYLDKLAEPGRALEELRALVDVNPGHKRALELLERLLGEDEAPRETRLGALGLLRSSYDSMKKDEDAVRVIEKGLEFVERGEVLRKEVARRLMALGRGEKAMDHYATLLVENPGDSEARRSLVELAGRSGQHELLARSLEQAAAASEGALMASLLAGAADVHREELEKERAIELYMEVLGMDEAEAAVRLAAARTLDDLLAEAGRSKERLEVLGRLAKMEQSSATRRFVVGEAARLAEELGEDDAVLEKWKSRLEMDSTDLEALDALVREYERSEAWKNLVKVLGLRAASRVGPLQKRSDLVRMASLQEKLGDAKAAIETLLGVVEEFGYDAKTVEALDSALAAAERWPDLAEMLENAASVAHERASRLMERLGEVYLEKLDDPGKALGFFSAAIVEDPRSEVSHKGLSSLLKNEECALKAAEALERAYRTTDDWEASLELIEPHIAAADGDEKVRILLRAARIQEERADNTKAALGLVARAFGMAPGDLSIQALLGRLGKETEEWATVAGAYNAAAEACEDSPARAAQLLCERGKILESEVWDEAGALAAFEAAMALDRRMVELDEDVAPMVARLQKAGPGLVETLLGLDERTPENIDHLCEAAEVAIEHGDKQLVNTTLEKLYMRGSRLLIGGVKAEGERSAGSATAWALEKLVALLREAGDDDQAARLLVDGAGLPLEPETIQELRLSAAEILMERGDANRAMSLFHESLEQNPEDLETLHRAVEMCEEKGRVTELVALKLLELDLTEELDRRLELRLEISRFAARLEQRGGRVESLLENLEEQPGHAASVEGLVEVLSARGQHEWLADILAEQAHKVGKDEQEAELWARVGQIREKLGHVDSAIDACMRVVDLACTSGALDALARLHAGASRPEVAAGWLERRLDMASEQERVPTMIKLARARIEARHQEKAVVALETAFEEAPRNAEVRRLLIDLYRKRGEWEPLVRVLTRAAEQVKEESTILAYAAEVHDICTTRLEAPEQSVSVLERALAVAPDDRDLEIKLSEALVPAERYDEARKLIEGLIKGFGRRRSPERAKLHLALARVARAQGDMDAALDNLETASKMDLSNATILKALAELARESGKLDRAEHAYRTLLVNMRHRQDEPGPVGAAEVQVELGRIAQEQGQEDKAAELRESAMESVAHDDSQAEGVQDNLREHGENDLLRRVLETRLRHVTSPRKRSGVLADLAGLLERDMDDPDGALDARIKAVETDPVFPPHHEAAQELANKLDQLDRYVSSLESLLDQARRGSDAYVRCELLLRLGSVMQTDRKDHKKAAELYKQAEETGVREVDAWRARVSLATDMGDKKEKKRLLDLLASVGEDKADAHASALFSIAEVHLSDAETLDEGLETLKKALEEDPRYDRAGMIMERASEVHGSKEEFMGVWEDIARRSEDDRVLLSYLERQVSGPDATHQQIREAADLALEFKEWERAESLMLRAVEIGQDTDEETGWAALSLARRKLQAGDLDGAVNWLGEASAVTDPAQVLEVGREVAKRASGLDGDPDLVAKMYEGLLESHPTSRDVWEPLASIYMQTGDVDRLGHLVDGTLDSLEDASDRSTLRLRHAGALMTAERADEAVGVLQAILAEQPENLAAQSMLIDYLERAGLTEDLAGLIETKLAAAQERRDLESIKSLTLRLGKMRGGEAEPVYRSALEYMPQDVEIVGALLGVLATDHDPAERAGLMETILSSKQGDAAAEYALELAEIHHYLNDDGGVLRVLETGFGAAPANVQLLSRLEQVYGSKGQHEALAARLLEAARHREETDVKMDLFMKAANLYREELENPSAAASALEEAALISPGDPRVVLELASAARDAGQSMKAIEKLSDLIEAGPGHWLLETLKMRAQLWTSVGDHEAAVEDLEEVFKLDASMAPELEKALETLRSGAAGDPDAERKVVTRIVDLHVAQGRKKDARIILNGWVNSTSEDVGALRQLRDFDIEDSNWEGVASTCEKLTGLEEGKRQINAVLDMAHAYVQLGRAKDARKQLEAVYKEHPDSRDVRSALRDVYETLDEKEGLAKLLQQDAEAAEDEDEKVKLLQRAAELLVEAGKSEGVDVLENLMKLRPADVKVATALCDALIDRYEHEAAGIVIDNVLPRVKKKRTPEISLLMLRRALIAEQAKEYELQLKHLEAAFKINRRNADIVAEVANVAEKLGNFELAQQALRNVHLVDGPCSITVVESLLRQARIAMMHGDNKKALLCARKALKEDPASEEAANLIADLL